MERLLRKVVKACAIKIGKWLRWQKTGVQVFDMRMSVFENVDRASSHQASLDRGLQLTRR